LRDTVIGVASASLRVGCAVAAALVLGTSVVSRADEGELRRLAAAAGQREPLIRIGLAPSHRVELTASKPFRIIDPRSGKEVWKPSFGGTLQAIAEGGPEETPDTVYRIQVGAFGNREAAERELRRLEEAFGSAGVVRHDPDRGNWRVRLGAADDRVELNPLMERLRGAGMEDLWVSEESAESIEGVELRLVDASYNDFLTGADRLAVVPTSGGRIRVDGKPYRGVVELRIDDYGRVRPINWVELELYLLGVVPAELGPEVWPELEALKAQAVAARTYAWKNRGQFESDGFDLCATPRCQVYKGASAEHPLSDRAVAVTRRQILTWEGRPIDALYTATCGGHTEDGGAIFPEEQAPYLKGVPCRAENAALASLRGTVGGTRVAPLIDETGADVTRDWALLRSAGVIGPGFESSQAMLEDLEPATLRVWTGALAALAGLAVPSLEGGSTETLGRSAAMLVADLGWTERAEVLLAEQDLAALLRDPEAVALPRDQRRALAYLAWIEGLRPYPDGKFGASGPTSAARLAPVLVRAGETYRAFELREGMVSGMGAESIRLVRGKGEIRLPLGEHPFLFGRAGGAPVTVEKLELWPGDRVRYHIGGNGSIDFLELLPPVKGVSDDRSSAVYSWETRRTRRELEAKINRRVSVGRLVDLQVVRRGVSGRVIELRVVGSRGETTVRGFDVRRLLDLRESLMVLEPQRDDRGGLQAMVFTGKGWGHGVGLCQVGAYGMALRGASYKEILAHYYRGARVEKLSGSPR
jgi:stage II sporulation protein D